MENLKIKVNSEAESKEVQQLFFELGYNWFKKGYMEVKTPETIMSFENGALSTGIRGSINHKEITLPELRDLVVLNRNDPNDGTHIDRDNKPWYVTSDNLFYCFEYGREWVKENQRVFDNYEVKPIEKQMKEYLRKNSNGTYSYIGTVRPEHVSDFMIAIPEGADEFKANKRFYKNGDSFFNIHAMVWTRSTLKKDAYATLWQRTTKPEELPFIDDEPSINDQYAEIEKVRQSHRTASEIADSALKHIRERAETYDQPTGERSAAKTAKAFNAITGKDITESEVWLLLQLLKDVRQWSREDYHQDSAEDCIAYAALKAESLEGGE